jgi:acetolactate synthase I/II/III large subunit
MARKDTAPGMDRREFLAGVAVSGTASSVVLQGSEAAAATTASAETVHRPSALLPHAKLVAAETDTPQQTNYAKRSPGSDFMVDVIKTIDIK